MTPTNEKCRRAACRLQSHTSSENMFRLRDDRRSRLNEERRGYVHEGQ